MYDELVRSLRICAEGEHCDKCTKWEAKQNGGLNVCQTALCKEAADAIEELSRKETPMKIAEIHVDEYFCLACGAENNCDQGHVQDAYCPACGQRLLPEPPKEE